MNKQKETRTVQRTLVVGAGELGGQTVERLARRFEEMGTPRDVVGLIKLAENSDEAVSAEELADSQAYLTGSMPLSVETSSGLAGIISSMEIYGLGLDYLLSYEDQVNAVTRESLQAAAQAFFSADEIAIAVAGPETH